MKNKKLIATVASLCLILVAVVAAVVGVIAAAQQNANTNISVSYRANDVYASIKAAARNEKAVTESSGTYTVVEDDWHELLGSADAYTVTFERTANTQTASAQKFEATLGSNNKFMVYRMTFSNLNQTYALNVLADYTKSATAGYTENVHVGYVWVDTTDLTWAQATSLVTLSANEQNLVTTGQGTKLTAITATTTLDHQVAANGTSYLYLIVAVADLDQDANYNLGKWTVESTDTTFNTLEFTLQRNARA